jgi:hypothetical protein
VCAAWQDEELGFTTLSFTTSQIMSELSVRYSALLLWLLCLGASHAYARASLRGLEAAGDFSELAFDDSRLGDLKQNVPEKRSTGLTSQQGFRDSLSGVAFKDSHFGNKKQVVPGQEDTNFDAQRGFEERPDGAAASEDFRLGDQKQNVRSEEVTTLGSQQERGVVLDGVPFTAHVLEAQGGRMQHVPVRTVTRSSSQWGPQRGLVSTETESTLGEDQPAVVLHPQSEPFLFERNGGVGARNDSRIQGVKHAPVVESRGSEEGGQIENAEVWGSYGVKGDRPQLIEEVAEPLEGYDSASVSTFMRREGAGISFEERTVVGLELVRRGRGQAMEEKEEQLWRGGKPVTKQRMRILDETGLVVGNPGEAEAGSFDADEVRTLRVQ